MKSVLGVMCACGVLISGSLASGDGIQPKAAPVPNRTIVVAELFTSEGCSSCPHADDLLSRLTREQSLPGVEILALGEHVDYWDRLGWRDPFSSATFSQRQSEYEGRVFHAGSIYTPQLVIDGQLECVGSDAAAVQRAITQAARAAKAVVGVLLSRPSDGNVHVDVNVHVPADLVIRDADVLVAVTEDNLVSDVRRGENRGRTLKHSAVVRSLTTVGTLSAQDHGFSTTASVPFAREWKAENARVSAFVQERQSRRIVGAASARVGDATGLR
jgi:hypothetical protein